MRAYFTSVCLTCSREFAARRDGSGKYCSIHCFRTFPTEKRFIRYVEKTDGCWLWKGSINAVGYGVFGYPGQGVSCSAHRASYELFVGDIPSGMLVCHKCDNPICVRPDHLFVGTQRDNMRDMIAKKRCVPRKLSESQVAQIRADNRRQWQIAKDFGISPAHVSNIKAGKALAEVG